MQMRGGGIFHWKKCQKKKKSFVIVSSWNISANIRIFGIVRSSWNIGVFEIVNSCSCEILRKILECSKL